MSKDNEARGIVYPPDVLKRIRNALVGSHNCIENSWHDEADRQLVVDRINFAIEEMQMLEDWAAAEPAGHPPDVFCSCNCAYGELHAARCAVTKADPNGVRHRRRMPAAESVVEKPGVWKCVDGCWGFFAAEPAGKPPDVIEVLLAKLYRTAPYAVAELCDKELDRSGALLGRVRTAAEVQPKGGDA